MEFNSYKFIFIFLPISLTIYFYLNYKNQAKISKILLIVVSIVFYSYYFPKYLFLLLFSICFNYLISKSIIGNKSENNKILLLLGILINLLILGFFKYLAFFNSLYYFLFGSQLNLKGFIFPLGISFFTLSQIKYLIDVYRIRSINYSFINYLLFVSFFPYIISGPIESHNQIIPQFDEKHNHRVNYCNLSLGLFLFLIGLLKKVIIADSFSSMVNSGFDLSSKLTFIESWMTSLAYTFQIFFDFSGYSDMALGIALMLNISIKINFLSPYKSTNIADFWKEWHISLSTWLRDYLFLPVAYILSRKIKKEKISNIKTTTLVYSVGIIITMLLAGIWHGANWTFVFWGLLHGIALVIYRIWCSTKLKMPKALSWLITFNFINLSWIFFRAKNFTSAINILKGMIGKNGIVLPTILTSKVHFLSKYGFKFGGMLENINGDALSIVLIFFGFVLLKIPNSKDLSINFDCNLKKLVLMIVVGWIAILGVTRFNSFLYFKF